MNIKKVVIAIFVFVTFAQIQSFASVFETRDKNYVDNILLVNFHNSDNVLSNPIIELNTDNTLLVSFDDLNVEYTQYFYSVTHCDFMWKPSEIWKNEYLSYLQEDQIVDYTPSIGTRTNYLHYSFSFPNDRFMISKSGNYILEVYTKSGSGEVVPVLSRRFLVFEPLVGVGGKAIRATSSEYIHTKQEVDFLVNLSQLNSVSPYQEIKTVIMQNFRWDNAIVDLKPFMYRNNILDYNYNNDLNLFDGGNEFRYLDLKSLKTRYGNVKSIDVIDDLYYVRALIDLPRTYKNYLVDKDMNGNFFFATIDGGEVENMADYALVQFSLEMPAPNVEGDFYVAGRFSNWLFAEPYKMKYNYNTKLYTADIVLKQGYYNYCYVYIPKGSVVGDWSVIEGNHSQTVNQYTVLVYYKELGGTYTRLVGVAEFQSGM